MQPPSLHGMAPRIGEGVDLEILTEKPTNTGVVSISDLPVLPSAIEANIVGRDYPTATNFPCCTSLPRPPGQTSTSLEFIVITEVTTATVTTFTLVTSQSVVTSAVAPAAPLNTMTETWSGTQIAGFTAGIIAALVLGIIIAYIYRDWKRRWRNLKGIFKYPNQWLPDFILVLLSRDSDNSSRKKPEETWMRSAGERSSVPSSVPSDENRREARRLARLSKQKENS
ncbi:hypothetical protein GGR57DRAFT_462328 [Xylariaceae sp. FL1272]|nr:hypothetical protein GGR57DRAFT_462328 [Xylariaceae sp. FL1272]